MKFKLPRLRTSILSRPFCGTKFFIIAGIVLLASCKKESDIGGDILPSDEALNLQAQDSTTLLTSTVKEDSLRTDEGTIVQIGDIDDPVFGNTNASLYTQVVIPNNLLNLDFGAGAVLDSSTLNLAYDYDYYGDSATQETFQVYQMTQDIIKDSVYYSNQSKQIFASSVIGDTTLTPRPRSNTIVGGDTLPPYLRIPINYSFANQIFMQSGQPNLASNEAFLQYMKGFYIKASHGAGMGGLFRFNLLDTLTRFTFYYHNATDDSLKFSFVVNTATAYFSHFSHNYTMAGPNLQAQLATPGVNTSNEVYVSGASGVKTKIEFPFLENWKNLGYKIAINKAEIVIKADPNQATADLPVNKQLYVVSIDSVGKQELITDIFESSSYFGGSVNTTTSEYHINIARYFQQLMAGEHANNGLYLKEFNPGAEGRRAVLGSSNPNSTYRMYLHLVYTRIN